MKQDDVIKGIYDVVPGEVLLRLEPAKEMVASIGRKAIG